MAGTDSKGHVHFDALDPEAEEKRSARGQEHRKEVVVSQESHVDEEIPSVVISNITYSILSWVCSVGSSGTRTVKELLKVHTGRGVVKVQST